MRLGGLVNQSIEVVKKSIHRTAPIYRDRSASLIPWRTEESASGRDPDHGLSSGRLGGQARQDFACSSAISLSASLPRVQRRRPRAHGGVQAAENSSDDHGRATAKVPYAAFKAKRSWTLLRRHLHATSDVSRGEAESQASITAAHHASAGRRSSTGRPCEDLQGET